MSPAHRAVSPVMPKCLEFRWGGERGRKRGQFESAHVKFPQVFRLGEISLQGAGKGKSQGRLWTAVEGRSATSAATQLSLSPSASSQAAARAGSSHGAGRISRSKRPTAPLRGRAPGPSRPGPHGCTEGRDVQSSRRTLTQCGRDSVPSAA